MHTCTDVHQYVSTLRAGTIILVLSLGGEAEGTTWGNDQSFKSFSDALVFHYLGQ